MVCSPSLRVSNLSSCWSLLDPGPRRYWDHSPLRRLRVRSPSEENSRTRMGAVQGRGVRSLPRGRNTLILLVNLDDALDPLAQGSPRRYPPRASASPRTAHPRPATRPRRSIATATIFFASTAGGPTREGDRI